MTIQFTILDISSCILLFNPALSKISNDLINSVQLDNGINIIHSLPIGKANLNISTSVSPEGYLDIHILSAKISGLSFFGLIKNKVIDTIINMSKKYNKCRVWKYDNNIRVAIPGINFISSEINGDIWTLEIKLNEA